MLIGPSPYHCSPIGRAPLHSSVKTNTRCFHWGRKLHCTASETPRRCKLHRLGVSQAQKSKVSGDERPRLRASLRLPPTFLPSSAACYWRQCKYVNRFVRICRLAKLYCANEWWVPCNRWFNHPVPPHIIWLPSMPLSGVYSGMKLSCDVIIHIDSKDNTTINDHQIIYNRRVYNCSKFSTICGQLFKSLTQSLRISFILHVRLPNTGMEVYNGRTLTLSFSSRFCLFESRNQISLLYSRKATDSHYK